MKILQTTTSEVQNRYLVGLLWKDQLPELPNDRCLPISRILLLEKKFEKSPSLKEKYVQTVNEYIKDGHRSILSKAEVEKESTKIINYIPQQAMTNVVNKLSKIRIVFDAGAKCKSTSLNENLQKGPDLLNNVLGILLHFRKRRYCMMADSTVF